MEIEELQKQILSKNDEIATLTSEKDNLTKSLNDANERIKKLQQTNQELFVRCTSPAGAEPEKKTYKSIEEISKEMRNKK